jgi:hypothetical protein
VAQAPSEPPPVEQGAVWDAHLGIERPFTRLRGEALSAYVVVEAFFYQASAALEGPPEVWSGFLRPLEIQPGSGADTALSAAVLRARESVLAPPPGAPAPAWAAAPPVTAADHQALARHMVRSLASIHAALLAELTAQGYPLARLQAHLDQTVRPGITDTIYPDPGTAGAIEELQLAEERKFDDLVVEALAAEAARRRPGGGR